MLLFLFVFKQKTAYDMRISAWSSDVCCSDLCQSTWAPLHTTWPAASRILAGSSLPRLAVSSTRPLRSAAVRLSLTYERSTGCGPIRSDERRVGNDCVSTCRFRLSAYPYNKTTTYTYTIHEVPDI